jgi:hypothetical protein
MKRGLSKKKLAIIIPVVLSAILALHFYRMSDNDSASIAYVLGTYIYSPIIAFGKLIDLIPTGQVITHSDSFML